MHTTYLSAIQSFEGYTPRAEWDYAQHTNGYGTRAKYAGEVIDRVEAERRFQAEISEAEGLVDKFAPGLDSGTRAALSSLTYNAGTKWMNSRLGEYIRNGDLENARIEILDYTKAGGETLPGLVARRKEEASWIGAGATPVKTASVEQPASVLPAVAQKTAAAPSYADGTTGFNVDPLSDARRSDFTGTASEKSPSPRTHNGGSPALTPAGLHNEAMVAMRSLLNPAVSTPTTLDAAAGPTWMLKSNLIAALQGSGGPGHVALPVNSRLAYTLAHIERDAGDDPDEVQRRGVADSLSG